MQHSTEWFKINPFSKPFQLRRKKNTSTINVDQTLLEIVETECAVLNYGKQSPLFLKWDMIFYGMTSTNTIFYCPKQIAVYFGGFNQNLQDSDSYFEIQILNTLKQKNSWSSLNISKIIIKDLIKTCIVYSKKFFFVLPSKIKAQSLITDKNRELNYRSFPMQKNGLLKAEVYNKRKYIGIDIYSVTDKTVKI